MRMNRRQFVHGVPCALTAASTGVLGAASKSTRNVLPTAEDVTAGLDLSGKVATQGRVVVVGSGNHRDPPPGGIQFQDLSGKSWSHRYHHSKLANGLFSLELARRLTSTRATSNCATPGPTLTGTVRHLPDMTPKALSERRSPAQGAATICYVATNPGLKRISGEYFADCNPAPQGDYQKDAAMAATLWDISTKLTSTYLG